MNVENLNEQYRVIINDILKNTNAQNINEVVRRAKEFQSMDELKEYIRNNGNNSNKAQEYMWIISISYVSTQFVYDNLEAILEANKEFSSNSISDLRFVIRDLPEEMKREKSEFILNWIITLENTELIIDMVSIMNDFPIQINNPENCNAILNKLIEVGETEEGLKNKVYFSILKERIIGTLPESYVKQNYKDIIEKLNTADKPFLNANSYAKLVQKIFEPNDEFKMEENELLEAFIYICQKGKEKLSDSDDRMAASVVKALPDSFVKQNYKEILGRLNLAENPFFTDTYDYIELRNKLLKPNDNFEWKNEDELLEVVKYVGNSAKENIPDSYQEVMARLINVFCENFFRKNMEYVEEHFEEIVDIFGEFDDPSQRNLETLLSELSEEIKIQKSEMLINWALDSEEKKVIPRRLLILHDVPVKLNNPENYSQILEKLVKAGESEEEHWIFSIVKNNIIKSLPDDIIKQDYKEIIEMLNVSKNTVLNQDDYIEIIQKLTETNDDFPMESEELTEALTYIKNTAKETIPDSYGTLLLKSFNILIEKSSTVNIGYIDENVDEVLEWFREKDINLSYDFRDFLSNLPEETKLKKSTSIIEWALYNDDFEQMKNRIYLIYDFPVKLDNPENYNQILEKISGVEAKDNSDTKDIFSIMKLNVIKGLPDFVVKRNYKDIIEKLNTVEGKNLDIGDYVELIKKVFESNEELPLQNEELSEIFKYIVEKSKERFQDANIKIVERTIDILQPEFVEANIEYIIGNLGDNTSEVVLSQLVGKLSGESIAKYKDRLKFNVSINTIGVCQKYLEYALTNKMDDIINDKFALQIIDLVDSLQNDGNQDYENIKNILKEARSSIAYPNMEKYDQYVPANYSENFEEMNFDDFDSFINELKIIKIINGKIPEKYCDYIIKQKLNKDSNLNQNLDKYLPMLKVAFQDKVKYLLEREGITGYKIDFFENDGKGTLGSHNHYNKIIDFLEENLIELDESNTHIINTAFHEVRHAVQAKDYRSTEFEKLNGDLYNMIKEEIIRRDDFTFYTINYSRMFCEIDARIAGAKGQSEYLKYLGISDDKIIESSGEKTITLKELFLECKEIEIENQRLGIKKVSSDGEIISVSQIASELIRKNPEWLKRYPVLSLEFNENGERKTSKELLADAIKVQNENVQDIYRKMFESEMKVDLKDVSESLEYIEEILKNEGSKSETIKEFASLIIKNESIKSLEKADPESEEFKKTLEILKRIKEKNPDLEISKYIEEKLSVFSEKNEIVAEKNADWMLSYTAINWIMLRKINSMEDFDKILEDAKKISDGNKYSSSIEMRFGLIDIMKKQLEANDGTAQQTPPLDVVSMFEKSLDIMERDKSDLLIDFVHILPDEMLLEKMPDILKIFESKGGKMYLGVAIDVMFGINPELLKQNENLGVNWFERISKRRGKIIFKITSKS